jgi:2-oxoisovalerate dehydrogenase E1 component
MAYRILNRLLGRQGDLLVPALDINAACSGYLYALQYAYDFLQSQPEGRVLVLTAEALSPLTDPNDLDTRLLFGDAASACLLYGQAHVERAAARVHRPELSGKCDKENALTVPFTNAGYIHMDGHPVFREAVRGMLGSMNRAAAARGISLDDLDLVVPHQANQRIMDAIEKRMGAPAFSNIRHFGNTSSTSIPLCLHDLLANPGDLRRIGLCAFGGGFTFGAAILEIDGQGDVD